MYSLLIVDDERVERNGLELLVRKLALPLMCAQAENGEIALRMLEQKHYDLLLTDIKMPFMDGLTLAREVRQLYPGIVVAILSAYGDFEKAQKAIQARVFRYLLKPVGTEEFKSVIELCVRDIEAVRREASERERLTGKLDRYRRKEAQLRAAVNETDDASSLKLQLEQMLSEDASPEGKTDNPAIQRVLAIIRDEYMNDIGLDVMAGRVNLTSGYLSSLFRQQLGQSYIKYLNNYRLDVAARLLVQTEDRVSDIAEQVGLPGESYFISLFRQSFGMTPRNYRIRMGETLEPP